MEYYVIIRNIKTVELFYLGCDSMVIIDEFGEDAEIEFRRLSGQDAQLLVDLVKAHEKKEVTLDYAEKFLSDSGHLVYGAICHNKIIGFILGYYMKRYDKPEPLLYIHEVFVFPDYRCQGIGTQLLSCVKNEAGSSPMTAFLMTNKSNKTATRLYERFGGVGLATDDVLYSFTLGKK